MISALFCVPNPSSELSLRYPGYYVFDASSTHLSPRFRELSADSRGAISLILRLDKLGTASHFRLAYEVLPILYFPFSAKIPIFTEIPREWRRIELVQSGTVCKE